LADKKLETMEHSIELAYGDDDEEDGDEADEYKSEVAKFVHSLKTIGEVEGGIGKQVSAVAQAQNDSESKVESSIKNVNDRNGFVKFLIGPKYGSINEIKTTVSENEKRIQVLNDLIKQVSDPAVKQVLQDQITILSQQNSNLKNFGENSQKGFSLFGWLIKMFS